MRFQFVADDYGPDGVTNASILRTIAGPTIKSVSVLPAGNSEFGNVPALLRERTVWGAHLYLTEYPLLTDEMRRACRGKAIATKRELTGLVLARRLPVQIVADEFYAQMRRLIELGFPINFADTHQNVHGMPSLYRAAQAALTRIHSNVRLRPIYQLRFDSKLRWRTVVSMASARLLGLSGRSRVLIGCPGFKSRGRGLADSLAAWDGFLERLPRWSIDEVVVPTHPGLSPLEEDLYGSEEFAQLLSNHAIEIQ